MAARPRPPGTRQPRRPLIVPTDCKQLVLELEGDGGRRPMTTADGDGGRRGARRREGAQIHPCWSRLLFAESSSSGTSSRRRGRRRASRKTWSLSLRQPFPAFQLHRSRVIMATLRCRPLLQLTLTCVRSSHSIVLNILTTITTLVRHGWPIQNQSQLRTHKPARRASVDEKRAVVSVPHRSGEERFQQVSTREESRTHLRLLCWVLRFPC